MKTLADKIIGKINFRLLLASLAFFAVMLYVIDYSVIGVAELARITNGGDILDMQHGYSVEKAYSMLDYLGEAGRNFYLTKILPADIFFPLSFMLFNLSVLAFLMKKCSTPDAMKFLLALPVVNMILDWSENVCFTAMLVNFPERLVTVCNIASCITHAKFTCVLLIILSAVFLLVSGIVRKIISSARKSK